MANNSDDSGNDGHGGGGPGGGGGHGDYTVNFHLGAEHTTFKTPGTTTLAAVKETGLDDLHIVRDPAFDYLLNFRSELVSDETQTLAHLVGEHGGTTVTLHVQKRPKGG